MFIYVFNRRWIVKPVDVAFMLLKLWPNRRVHPACLTEDIDIVLVKLWPNRRVHPACLTEDIDVVLLKDKRAAQTAAEPPGPPSLFDRGYRRQDLIWGKSTNC